MSGDFRRHGLTGTTKQRVFDALFQWQSGRCFICGISQAEIYAKYQERYEEYRRWAEELPAGHEEHRAWYQRKIDEGPAPVHRKLHIDHCHASGAIRGLLCEECNMLLGSVENYGLFRYYSAPGYLNEPCLVDRLPEDENEKQLFERSMQRWNDWLEKHRDILLLYMQPSRWLPRKDISFYLQRELHREAYQEVTLNG
jgi:hypothetical protein